MLQVKFKFLLNKMLWPITSSNSWLWKGLVRQRTSQLAKKINQNFFQYFWPQNFSFAYIGYFSVMLSSKEWFYSEQICWSNVSVNHKYSIYLINRPGRLLNFWTLRVGAYSRWALIWGCVFLKFSLFSASIVCLFCNKTIQGNDKNRRCNKARFL